MNKISNAAKNLRASSVNLSVLCASALEFVFSDAQVSKTL